jgi:predicted Zn finger-like uncharacterized protein
MKFACERCGRKYMLADDKVAAKDDVRMKCRHCGEVIVVKEAGEIVAKTPATPVPRLPLAEGALPPPAMPPQFKRSSARVAPGSSNSDAEAEQTAPPAPVDAAGDVDVHGETIADPIRPSAAGLPRPSLPRPGPIASKRVSAPPPTTRSAEPPPPTPSSEQAPSDPTAETSTEDEGDRTATVEPVALVAMAESAAPVPVLQAKASRDKLAAATQELQRLWLGASGAAEKRRMLIALGVGFVLGTLFGLMF